MRQRKIILSYFIFFIALQLLFLFIIPPFQSPDETYHFPVIAIYALGEEKSEAIERAVIKIMDRHNWWRYIGMGRPDELPSRLAAIPFLGGYDARAAAREPFFRLFHHLVGKLLKVIGVTNIETLYRMAQLISISILLVSLYLIYLTFSKISCLNSDFFWGFWLVALWPQLLLFGPAATPESFNFFLGSLFFYCSYSLLLNQINILAPIGVVSVASIGLLVDRSDFSLIILIPFVLFLMMNRKRLKSFFIYSIVLASMCVAAFFFFKHYSGAQLQYFISFLKENILIFRTNLAGLFSRDPFTRDFFLLLIDSLYFKFGWMAFGPAKGIYFLWRLILGIGLTGFFIFLIKNLINLSVNYIKKRQDHGEKDREKIGLRLKAAVFTLITILVLIGGIWAYSGARKAYIQGRQVFPLIMPIAFILTSGLISFFGLAGRKIGRMALATVVSAEFIFLNFCIWNYIIPVFHLTHRSPHPGL